MMVDNGDDTELKLVDFGLSKILGPNEASTEPFGTIVIQNFNFAELRCARSVTAETLWKER
jgi:hypothetical protein